MPSGMGGMGTGSDTRMYAPRSESTNMYSGDDSYRYGIGDPKAMEEYRDKKQKEKESAMSLNDLPHLKVEIDKPDMPMMPPMPPPPSDMGPPIMDDDNENAVGAEVSQMTGMPDMGNLSMANASGLVPSGSGQLVAMSKPMDLSWRLLKGGLKDIITSVVEIGAFATIRNLVYRGMHLADAEKLVRQASDIIDANPQDYNYNPDLDLDAKEISGPPPDREFTAPSIRGMYDEESGDFTPTFDSSWQQKNASEPMDLAWRLLKKEGEPWYQKPFDSEMREKEKLTQTHAKLSESSLPRSKKKTGLDRAHLSVHYGHRGKGRIRPLTLEPEKYAQYQGQRQQRALGGNIAMPKSLLGRAPSG